MPCSAFVFQYQNKHIHRSHNFYLPSTLFMHSSASTPKRKSYYAGSNAILSQDLCSLPSHVCASHKLQSFYTKYILDFQITYPSQVYFSPLETLTSNFMCVMQPNQLLKTIATYVDAMPIMLVLATDYFDLLFGKIAQMHKFSISYF